MVRFCKIATYIFFLYSILSCSNKEEFLIKGEILNLKNPHILVTWLSADTVAIDTIHVDVKGKFSYKNKIDTLTTFSLYLNNYESAAVVFAD